MCVIFYVVCFSPFMVRASLYVCVRLRVHVCFVRVCVCDMCGPKDRSIIIHIHDVK